MIMTGRALLSDMANGLLVMTDVKAANSAPNRLDLPSDDDDESSVARSLKPNQVNQHSS